MRSINLRVLIMCILLYSCSGNKIIEDNFEQNEIVEDSLPVEITYDDTFIDTIVYKEPIDEPEPVIEKMITVKRKTILNTVEYDKVVAYEYEQTGPRGFKEVVHNYSKSKKEIPIGVRLNFFSHKSKKAIPVGIKLRGNTIVRKIKTLSKEEMNDFDEIFSSTTTYGGEMNECFNPNFGVVYYKDQNPSLIVEVSLECNYLKATPRPQVLKEVYCELFAEYINDSSRDLTGTFDDGCLEILNSCSCTEFYDTTSSCYDLVKWDMILGFKAPQEFESFIENIGFTSNDS